MSDFQIKSLYSSAKFSNKTWDLKAFHNKDYKIEHLKKKALILQEFMLNFWQLKIPQKRGKFPIFTYLELNENQNKKTQQLFAVISKQKK